MGRVKVQNRLPKQIITSGTNLFAHCVSVNYDNIRIGMSFQVRFCIFEKQRDKDYHSRNLTRILAWGSTNIQKLLLSLSKDSDQTARVCSAWVCRLSSVFLLCAPIVIVHFKCYTLFIDICILLMIKF